MSALYTALVEGESKEQLVSWLLNHRMALRKAKHFIDGVARDHNYVEIDLLRDEIDVALSLFHTVEAGNKDRVEVKS